MKNSNIVYILLAISLIIAILSFFEIGNTLLFQNIIWKIAFLSPLIALYFANKAKKQENQELGNKLMILAIVVFVITLVINTLPFFRVMF